MGAALIALFPFGSGAVAQEPDGTEALPTADLVEAPIEEAPIEEAPVLEHEFYGDIVAGWRLFIDEPPSGFGRGPGGVPLTAKETESRAKFERFGEIPEGPFLESLYLGAATADGRFVADLWATDVAQNDQNYQLELSRPGKHYLFLEWDQIPYLASTSAKSLWNTSDPSNLTIADPIQADLEATAGTPAAADTINSNVRQLKLGTRRDTGSVSYTFTPTPAWSIEVDYSREEKEGRQPFGTTLNGFSQSLEFPLPIDYTTQNFGASAGYVGTYGDNKRFNINLAYNGSIFENEFDSVTFDNPFQLSPADVDAPDRGHQSLAPDNYAHRYALTSGVDLPYNSRYMGTVSFNQMRQDDDFIPKTVNPAVLALASPLPQDSLEGKIDTLLINNVLTTQLTSDLTSTLRYRYYDLNNRTPELVFDDYVEADGSLQGSRRSLAIEYTRQNASAQLDWRARPWLSTGGMFGWERYDRDRRDVDITDEFSGKVFTDVTALDWATLRASYLFARRDFNEYDAEKFTGDTFPDPADDFPQSPLLRKFDLADRDRNKVDVSLELMTPVDGLIVSPLFSWQDDEYSDGSTTGGLLGLKQDRIWNAGVEVAYAPTSTTTFFAGYVHEELKRELVNRSVGGEGLPGDPANNWGSEIHDVIDTVYTAVNVELIPERLDFRLGYTFSIAKGNTDTYPLGAAGLTSDPPFPDVDNTYHRLDAVLTHTMDPDLVRRLGWEGEVTTSLGYSFERNRMTNWAIDDLVPYMIDVDPGTSQSLYLAGYNPNFTAHFIGMKVGFHW